MKDTSTRFVGAVFCLAIAIGCVGCAEGGSTPSKPVVVFPSRAEIAAIPAVKPKLAAFGEIDTSDEPWAVQVEPSTQDTPYEDASAWGDFLREAVKAHAQTVSLSSPLKCASAELAKVNRRSARVLPPMNLMRFIVARCGAMVTSPRPLVWRVDAPSTVTDDMIMDAAKKQLAPALETMFAHGEHLLVGLGVARDDKGVSVVVTAADDEATLDPTPLRADANHVVSIRGTVRGQYESLYALVNQGALGVAECTKQGDLPPPHFAFTCKLAESDPYAWVEILGKRRGLVLARDIAAGIVTAGTDAPIVYKPRSDTPPLMVRTPAELTSAIVNGVNRARATARLSPLTLDTKQSAENERLSGTLINASFGEDVAGSSDRAAIGLLAGWDVAGMIRGATIFVAAIAPTNDATAWLDWALERPAGRVTLLDPTSRVIAIGSAVPEQGSGLGAAVTTYALFQSDDHSREEATLYARIDAARAARGLTPPTHLSGFPELHQQAVRVLTEAENPGVALQSMLEAATARSGSSAMGYVVETTDIEHVTLPAIAMRAGDLRIAVVVTHHRAEGAAWGQYVVFLITVGDNVTQTMQANNARGGFAH
ncbi:MAG: hypothetical protein ABI461_17875 [Polyangiaceae bacterium]